MWTPLMTGLGASAGFALPAGLKQGFAAAPGIPGQPMYTDQPAAGQLPGPDYQGNPRVLAPSTESQPGFLNTLASILDTPRRETWKLFGLPETGAELMTNMGMDPDSIWTQALGMGSEMLLDPLNLIGAGLGGKIGRFAGTVLDRFPEVQRMLHLRNAELARDLNTFNKTGFADIMPNHAAIGYRDDLLSQLPRMDEIGKPGTMRNYSRVDPQVAQAIDNSGLGYRTAEGTTVYRKPDFAAGRGGVLKPVDRLDDWGIPPTYADTLTGGKTMLPHGNPGAMSSMDDLLTPDMLHARGGLEAELAHNQALLNALRNEPPLSLANRYMRGTMDEIAQSPTLREVMAPTTRGVVDDEMDWFQRVVSQVADQEVPRFLRSEASQQVTDPGWLLRSRPVDKVMEPWNRRVMNFLNDEMSSYGMPAWEATTLW